MDTPKTPRLFKVQFLLSGLLFTLGLVVALTAIKGIELDPLQGGGYGVYLVVGDDDEYTVGTGVNMIAAGALWYAVARLVWYWKSG